MGVSFNETAANQVKEPEVLQGFTYDTITSGGCLNKFDEIGGIVSDISGDVENIIGLYSTMQSYYTFFTDFNETINNNKTALRRSIDGIKKGYDLMLESLKTQVGALQQNDSTLMSDLEGIEKMISNSGEQDQQLAELRNKNDNETPAAPTPVSEGGATEQPTQEQPAQGEQEQTPADEIKQPGAEQPSTEEQTNPSTKTDEEIDKAVDDVISGKYGSGDERKKALEEAGFDPAVVQGKVNERLNGGGSSSSAGGGSGAAPSGEAAATQPQPQPTPEAQPQAPATDRPEGPKGGTTGEAGFIMPNSQQMEEILQVIYEEGGKNPAEACNIASTMINRARSAKWTNYGGNDVYKQATFPSQYVSVGNVTQADVSPEVRAAVTELFNNAYNGGGTSHNFDSFRANYKEDYGGTILVPGGNRYK